MLIHQPTIQDHGDEISRHAWKYRKYALIPLMLVVFLGGIMRYLLIKLMLKKLFLRLKRHLYPPDKNPFTYNNLPEKETG